MHVALRDRQPRRLGRRGQRRFGVLRARPHLAFVGRVERSRVQRLHAGVRLVWIAVDCFDLLRRASDRCFRVAFLVSDEGLLRIEAGLEHLANRGAGDLAFSPSSHATGNASSAVLACHQLSATTPTADSPTWTTCFTPLLPAILAASKLFTLPPCTGQALTAAYNMPGSLTSIE